MEKALEYKEMISTRLEKYSKLRELEEKTGIEKFYIFSAGLLVLGVFLFVIGGARLIIKLLGFLYPAYQSFKALSSSDVKDDTQWLTYWVVFALYNITEPITDLLLSWIPLYFLLKTGFLVWCYHPNTLGANVIYHNVIKPYIAPHVGAFDSVLRVTSDAAKNIAAKLE
uniref:Uncharacterized protein AlNc14C935G12651 n=1 Tax=Albugo laibachii Nc14 TaxID=890382 RepID=F0X2B1_9STRA|nr:conserved hypothetical protein [Albugo laibachii Nc14]|eukprot:CCA27992.1 conserved hypothetical protein [Albugo laibachii Nc14]